MKHFIHHFLGCLDRQSITLLVKDTYRKMLWIQEINDRWWDVTVINSWDCLVESVCLSVCLGQPPYLPAGGTMQALMYCLGEGEGLRDQSVTVTIVSPRTVVSVCSGSAGEKDRGSANLAAHALHPSLLPTASCSRCHWGKLKQTGGSSFALSRRAGAPRPALHFVGNLWCV